MDWGLFFGSLTQIPGRDTKSNLNSTDANLAPKKLAPNQLLQNSHETDLFRITSYKSHETMVKSCRSGNFAHIYWSLKNHQEGAKPIQQNYGYL